METQQLLLALCASHWKADHVLRSILMVRLLSGVVDTDEDGTVEQSPELEMNNKHRPDVINSPAHGQKKSRRCTEKQRAPAIMSEKGMSFFSI